MKICQVTPYDLSHDGGVNRHVLSLAEALRHVGHRVHVLGPASGAVPRLCSGLRGIVKIAANGSVARIGLLVARGAVHRFLNAGDFDVIHVHEPWLPGITRHAVRWGRAPVVGTFHSYADSETLAVRVARRALGIQVSRMHAAIAVSAAAADFARTVFRRPTRIVPNGVDATCFAPARSMPPHASRLETLPTAAPLRVLFVGRYDEPRKGLRHIVQAAANIRLTGRRVELLVAGSGEPVSDSILAHVRARFLGRLSDAALADAYRNADVFCAPSLHGESFGLVLIEAMACGCPVVATNIRGYREAVGDAALLVPPGDPASLARAVLRVADDHALRRRLIARGHARARELSWARLVYHVDDVYQTCLASGSGNSASWVSA